MADANWGDDDELFQTDDAARPGLGVGTNRREGDLLTLRFEEPGEIGEGQNGKYVAWPVEVTDFEVAREWYDMDDDAVEAGEGYRFITSSARLLSELKPHRPLAGKEVLIRVDGTDFDAAYSVEVVDESDD